MAKQKKGDIRHIVGIDEVGRGPLAGPVAVGVICMPAGFKHPILKRARDSKMLSAKVREEIFMETKRLHQQRILLYSVSMMHAETIDRKGISYNIRLCIRRCLKKCNVDPEETLVLLDGSLKAPKEFLYQRTIIKGDQKEKVISLASIMAKVVRDRWMTKIARKYPGYGFEIHKGYGTRAHRELIKKKGISAIHRKSFCKQFL